MMRKIGEGGVSATSGAGVCVLRAVPALAEVQAGVVGKRWRTGVGRLRMEQSSEWAASVSGRFGVVTLLAIIVMLDLVAVRAENNTLVDFLPDRLPGEPTADHVGDVGVLGLIAGVMEFERAEVGESTPRTVKCFLVLVQPQPESRPPDVGSSPLALLTAKSAVSLAIDDPANFKGSLGPVFSAVFTANEFENRVVEHGGISARQNTPPDQRKWRGGVFVASSEIISGRLDLN